MDIISQEHKRQLEARTTKGMPPRPGDRGWTSEQINRKLYEGLLYIFDLLGSFELQIKKIVDGYTNEEGTQVIGLLAEIEQLKNDVREGYQASVIAEKAIADRNGLPIHTTYATIQAIKNGTIGAMKYLNKQGGEEGYIIDILTEVRNNLRTFNTFVSNHFDGDVANESKVSDRARKDASGHAIETFYAKETELASVISAVQDIIGGSSIVGKATKDKDGHQIDTTYVKKESIVDNVTSTSTDAPLSANQGKYLYGLIVALQTLLQSDDSTLDELQEIVTYIKGNKALIEAVTDAKISKTDIINNLVTNDATKPISAAVAYALNNGKVDKTRKIAGIDMTSDITAAALKTALGIDFTLSNAELIEIMED